MADAEPTTPTPPRNSKRRRQNRERRGSSAEFVILADDGKQHLVQAVDPPYESDYIDTTDSPDIRVTRSRARDGAPTNRSGNQSPTSTPPHGVVDSLGGHQAFNTPPHPLSGNPDIWSVLGVSPRATPTVEDHSPVSMLERPVATPAEVQTQLEARITQLETENAALRHDNAALGVAVTESNDVPRNDQEALLNLVRTTNVPRGVFLRLLDNNDFVEWWRLGNRHGGSRGGGSGSGSGQVESRRGRSGRGASGRGES